MNDKPLFKTKIYGKGILLSFILVGNSQFFSSFCPSGSQNATTIMVSHSFHKTVFIFSFAVGRLKSSLGHSFIFLGLQR